MNDARTPTVGLVAGHGMALALAGMIRGVEPMFPSNKPALYNPPKISGMTGPEKEQMRQRGFNEANRLANRRERQQRPDPVIAARQYQINGMTNWQRSQWGKAGYPQNRIEEFLCLRRRAAK